MKQTPIIPIFITATALVLTLLGDTVDIFMDLSFAHALELAAEEDRVVMAKFHADWCPWCQKMDRETFWDEGVKESLNGFIPLRINVDEGEGLALARRVGVVSIPTVIFFDSRGEALGKYTGFQSPRGMMKILKRHSRHGAQTLK